MTKQRSEDGQNKTLLNHLKKGYSISWLTAAKYFGISSLHRRLADLRNGVYDGNCYPIDYGHYVEYGGKRFKVYQMDLEV